MKLAADSKPQIKLTVSRRTKITIIISIFLLAFGVRLLSWHDTRLEVRKVQTVVTEDYKRVAQLLRQGGVRGFFSSASPLADPNNLGHPPGYSILIAFTHSLFGESDAAVQFVQITFDALSAVIIFLIVAELFSLLPAVIAGVLAALSPQLAWNSVLLLPDSLAIFPILLAVYLLAIARKKPRLFLFIAAGALVGISCWLRANGMLLTFFMAAAVPLLITSKGWLRYSLAVVFATCLVVLPLTLRNAIVFHRFIPLSLGAGQTLLEGIADYDTAGRFNIPNTDMGIMKQEAEMFQRPDYYGTLFNPDGVERERARLRRGFAVIRSHPFWFSGVMVRRAGSMLRLERSRLISTEPPVSHSLELTEKMQPVWSNSPADLLDHAFISPTATKLIASDGQTVTLWCDDSKDNLQLMTSFVAVRRNMDYVFVVPVKIEQGRVRVAVNDTLGKFYARDILEPREGISAQDQPTNLIKVPLVATAQMVRVTISNEAPSAPPIMKVGTIKVFELGPARFLWTRYLRLAVNAIQKLFLTAVMLPLAIIGLAIVILRKQCAALVILSVVSAYYFLVQSAFHTEYRYVLAVNYFVFAFAAVGISWLIGLVVAKTSNLWPHKG